MRLSAFLGILAIGNFILAFVIQGWILVIVGAGIPSDAYVASLVLPQLIFTIVTFQLPAVLVPLLSGTSPEELRRDSWSALWTAGGVFAAVAILLLVTTSLWVPMIVPGLNPESKALAIRLSRIQAFNILFMTLLRVVNCVCHARKQFVRVELADLLSNTAALGAIVYFLPRYGIEAAAWITIARPAASTVVLLPSAGRPALPVFDGPFIRTALQRLRPIILGSTYSKSGPVFDRFLSSWTGTGTLTLLHYSERLYGATFEIFRRSLVSPVVPRMTEYVKRGDWPSYRALCLRRLQVVALICILGLTMIAALGLPLLRLLAGRGGLTIENVNLLWTLLLLMGGYLLGGGLNYVLAQAIYSTGDTVTPPKIGVITFTIGIPLKIAGLYVWDIRGIAAATGAQHLFSLVLFAVAWRRTLSRAVRLNKTAEPVP